MITTPVASSFQKTIKSEEVLVVPRGTLLPAESINKGVFEADHNEVFNLIDNHKLFMPRNIAETNFDYQQIIPYLLFQYQGSLFVMKRSNKANESRLHNKYTIGIGGHVRKEDLENSSSLLEWATREFLEEVKYEDDFKSHFLGVISDDSNEVGKVHIGLVFLLQGETANISVKEELESGVLVPFQELEQFYDEMESWSQICINYYKEFMFCSL